MKKARILLKYILAMIVESTLYFSGGCYLVDAYHPDLPANVPPSIDYTQIEPGIYGEISIDLSSHRSNDLQSFNIKRIYDPDKEIAMYGRYAINYTGVGTVTGERFMVSRKTESNSGSPSDIYWQGSFNIEIHNFSPPGIYQVVAAVSDELWKEPTPEEPNPGFFAVPDDTIAAFVKWTIVSYCSIPDNCGEF